MSWLPILQFAVLGFTVVGIHIMYRDQMRHLNNMRIQNQSTWNQITKTQGHIEGLHDKYAKLYDRVTKLEKAQ
jgi:hypothetical protein